MNNKLLIVESPAKAKTIAKYLGGEFTVLSSKGHIRDLPKKGLSVKITGSADEPYRFTPTYEISPDKKKIVDSLRKAAKESSEIFLAPDPDREGEAIAWHLAEVLKSAAKDKPLHRVSYNEITPNAVRNAIQNPGEINLARVDAQQSRRILDRLVGFKVSPMLWKNLQYGYSLSAGRVQSVALRLLVEREREIQSFVPESYWILGVEASKSGDKADAFIAKLSRIDGEKPSIKTQEAAATCINDLDGASLRVASVKTTPKTRRPYPPFTTSSLQQAASSVCGFSPKRTMDLAQKLYEAGHITYMRTDSVNVSAVAAEETKNLIAAKYGEEYLPPSRNVYKSRAGAQEGHEAIRPTHVDAKPNLTGQEAKLYDLIWRRFVASQMANARLSVRTVSIAAEKPLIRHSYLFTVSHTTTDFPGFLAVMNPAAAQNSDAPGAAKKDDSSEESDEVKSLPPLAEGDSLTPLRWLSDRKETKPPARFSEASLVKALEENGVGRPSTYAATIELLVNRQYAEREARQLVPTKRGADVNDWLVKNLEPLFNVGYTAQMESELDLVEAGRIRGDEMLESFYRKFLDWIENAKAPPPPAENFLSLFALLDEVSEWKEPSGEGKKAFNDRAFADSVRQQFEEGKKPVSEKQLKALARLAVSYRAQIADCETRLSDLGYADLLETAKSAPPRDIAAFCFETLDRVEGASANKFIASVRKQFDNGHDLSEKQFAVIVRNVVRNCGALEDFPAIREKLAPHCAFIDSIETRPETPEAAELFKLLDSVAKWREPVTRGKRTFNDAEFVESVRKQYLSRKSLTDRQLGALRRVCETYHEQIPDFAAAAASLGLKARDPRAAAAKKSSKKSAATTEE